MNTHIYEVPKRRGIPPARRHVGMHLSITCPECGNRYTQVIDSRVHSYGIRRVRVCQNEHRFTTHETAVSAPMRAFDPVI